jgi:hypothetical protein
MKLLKEVTILTEGALPTTGRQVIEVLNKELKGKMVSAFGPRDGGIWGANKDPLEFKIKKVDCLYSDDDEEESYNTHIVNDDSEDEPKPTEFSTTVDIELVGYNSAKNGLIYTGKNFLRNLSALIKQTSVARYIKGVYYTEQGMQGKTRVNVDILVKLPKA